MKKFLFGLLSMTLTIAGAATLQEKDGRLLIDNHVYTMTIAPKLGGRITSWLQSRDQRQFCYWDSSAGHAGLLDDKGEFSAMNYHAEIVLNSPQQIRIRLTSPSDQRGLSIAKTIIVDDASAAFRVEYEYRNQGKTIYQDELMTRNYLLPGTPASAE